MPPENVRWLHLIPSHYIRYQGSQAQLPKVKMNVHFFFTDLFNTND
jgi:hypothetical protein